jgi:superfamily II DNA/RNA helicase
MHGHKPPRPPPPPLANFEAGVVDTLVATDVAARGIDVAGITHVINYDIPATRDDYVHRIGRTARAGASGVGVTLVAHDQASELAGMVGDLGLDRELELAGIATGSSQRSASGAGGDRSRAGGDRSRAGGDRSRAGGDRSRAGGDRSRAGGDRSRAGGRRSNSANGGAQRSAGSARNGARRRGRDSGRSR